MGAPVLVVEDDIDLAETMVRALWQHGYVARRVENGADAIAQVSEEPPHAVILDLGLPDMDGLDVCARLREGGYEGGIMIATARTAQEDIERSAVAGADDFLAKPFGLAELQARVGEVVRGNGRWGRHQQVRCTSSGLTLDTITRRAHAGPLELTLTDKEFDILAVLADRAGAPVTEEALLVAVWGASGPSSQKAFRATLKQLGRRLAATSADQVVVEDDDGVRLESRGSDDAAGRDR
jgi:DNA-binding response OmpR family regulator